MKLNLKTDYALRVLIFLQRKEKATIREVAEYYDVKKNHLSVVVNKLSELGYIDSSPGPKGGISLKAKTLEKSIAEIILEFEDFDLVECFNSDSSSCPCFFHMQRTENRQLRIASPYEERNDDGDTVLRYR